MGIRPHFQLICGVHDFPVNEDGYPVPQPQFMGYPCYVSKDELPLWEKMEDLVPRPEKPTYEQMHAAREQKDLLQLNMYLVQVTLYNHLTDREGNAHPFHEVFQYSSGEYGVAGLYGYKIGEALSIEHDHLRYALCSLEKKYQQSGFQELPSLTLDDVEWSPEGKALKTLLFFQQNHPERVTREVLKAIDLRALNRLKQDIRNHQRYVFFGEFDEWAKTALWLFRHLGLFVRRRDLRLLLIWEWS